jgi:DNA-binding response OmpR family regulator
MYTGYPDEKWKALESGADLFLSKPLYFEEMFKELFYLKRLKISDYQKLPTANLHSRNV